MTMDYSTNELIERAREVAVATGGIFLFGVRWHHDSVFANCDGVEADGSTFHDALEGVIVQLQQRASRELSDARDAQKRAERIKALHAAVSVPSGGDQ